MLSVLALGVSCIGEVYRAELEEGPPLVAKVDREGESHLEREAYMLRYLRQKSELPVPEVYHASETLLLMEFVEGSSRFSKKAQDHAAELLAALHDITSATYGHERDTLIGSLSQPNPPVLIHGDVWSANVLARGDRITAFLDPAIYYADPEIELAFISLFDSFGHRFFDRYQEIRPIRDGFFEVRRDLYNLYPLLVHTYYFGDGYLGSVRNMLDRFGV